MKKVKLRYSDITNIVRTLVEQEDESNIVEVSPQELKKYLEYVSYNGDQLGKFPQFRGKKLKITGSVDLRNQPLTSLGPIIDVNGHLDISGTKVRSWGNFQGNKYRVSIGGTPLQRIQRQQELQKKQNELDSYRENDDWNLEKGNDIGEKAWALLYYLEANDKIKVLTQEGSNRKTQIIERLDELRDQYDNATDTEEIDTLSDQISGLEEQLEEFEDYIDVYDLYPDGEFYDMTSFKINRMEWYNEEFAVGDQNETEESALDYAQNLIDDIGVSGFNRGFIEQYIDEDSLIEYMDYDSDVRNNLDVYFDSNDYDDFSRAVLKEIQNLKVKLSQIEEKHNQALESGNEELANELQEEYDEVNSELEDLESSPDEISEEKIQEKIDELNYEIKRDPLSKINEHGFDITNFIDTEALKKGYVDEDGYGIMNTYDGQYDTIEVNDTTYYIMQVNG